MQNKRSLRKANLLIGHKVYQKDDGKDQKRDTSDSSNKDLKLRCFTSQERKKVHFNREHRLSKDRYKQVNHRNRKMLDEHRSTFITKQPSDFAVESNLGRKKSSGKNYDSRALHNYVSCVDLFSPEVEESDTKSLPKSTSNKIANQKFFRSKTEKIDNPVNENTKHLRKKKELKHSFLTKLQSRSRFSDGVQQQSEDKPDAHFSLQDKSKLKFMIL